MDVEDRCAWLRLLEYRIRRLPEDSVQVRQIIVIRPPVLLGTVRLIRGQGRLKVRLIRGEGRFSSELRFDQLAKSIGRP